MNSSTYYVLCLYLGVYENVFERLNPDKKGLKQNISSDKTML